MTIAMRNVMRCLLVSVLAVACICNARAQQSQVQADKLGEETRAAQKALDDQLPIVDINAPKPTEASARAKREAKDKRHNQGREPIQEGLTSAVGFDHPPADFPPMPVAQSTTIVIGRIADAQANLSDDRSGVYSEVIVKIDQILKDKAGIKPGLPIVAERDGGRVRFPSGAIFRYFIAGLGIPKVGRCYLLFLEQLEDGDFRILTGYELLNGHVVPLDESGVVHFEKYEGADETAFLTDVREAISKKH